MPAGMSEAAFKADLTAVLVAVQGLVPLVLTLEETGALPSGPLAPEHRSIRSVMSNSSTPSPIATVRAAAPRPTRCGRSRSATWR
jgi:hypothetical protein